MSDLSVIKKLKVAELKAALSARGLAVKGKKDDLVKRLAEAMESDEQAMESDEQAMEPDDQAKETEEPEVAEEVTEDVPAESPRPEEDTSQQSSNEDPDDTVPEEQSDELPDDTVDTTENNEVNIPTNESNLTNSPSDKSKKDTPGDWVMVEAPSTDETSAVKEASGPQDDIIEAPPEKKTSDQPLQESTVDTPSVSTVNNTEDVGMKEAGDVASTTNDETKTDVKPDDANATENVEEKKPEKVQIPDVMVEVEDEDLEEFVACEVPEGKVGLDQYTSDLHFVVQNDGLSGRGLSKNGFAYMWSGARANRGAKGGKLGYEVKITKFEEIELPAEEAPVNAIRIGWSAETTELQLGEASLSYGFESTGKVCASSSFFEYGKEFGEGDVIGTYLDLESEPKTLKYTKNGEDLGVAMSLTVNLEEKPLFPHILVRNVCIELNFGGNENPWFETPEGYSLIQDASEENTTEKTSKHVTEDEKSEVIVMVGLPSAGKTSWARRYCDSHAEKYYNVIGMSQLLERCRLEGKKRRKSDKNHEQLMTSLMKALTKLYNICPKRTRNYIYDQNNVYNIAQEKKMELFGKDDFKRKAVVIVPTHDNLRRRTSDAKRKGDGILDVPFGDLCDMKCEFAIPEVGETFDEVTYPELDEKNAGKTIRDYQSDGSRAKKTGRDDYYPKKRPRYDDRRRDDRYGGRDNRREGWRGSGSGYGGYAGGGGGYHKRSDSGGSYNKGGRSQSGNYNDPYRRHSGGGGGNYRQSSYGSGGGGGYRSGGYGSGSGGYGQNYGSGGYGQYGGSYGSQGYGANYGGGGYGGYNYGSYNQSGGGNQSTGGQWSQQQYGSSYNQSQQTQGGWGTGGQWAGYNYSGRSNYNSGSNNYSSGGGYGY